MYPDLGLFSIPLYNLLMITIGVHFNSIRAEFLSGIMNIFAFFSTQERRGFFRFTIKWRIGSLRCQGISKHSIDLVSWNKSFPTSAPYGLTMWMRTLVFDYIMLFVQRWQRSWPWDPNVRSPKPYIDTWVSWRLKSPEQFVQQLVQAN